MKLIDRAGVISQQAESLKEKGATLHHLRNVAVVQEAIEKATQKTQEAAEAMRALRSIDIAPSVDHKAFAQAADRVEQILSGARPSLVADPLGSSSTINEAAEPRKSVTRALQENHSAWRDSIVGELETILRFAESVRQVWPNVHTEVKQLVSDITKDRNELPTIDSVRRVNQAVERLRQIPLELAPTAETRRFLVAACSGGATFADLTGPVRDWLKDKGLERRLRIRISGSDDD